MPKRKPSTKKADAKQSGYDESRGIKSVTRDGETVIAHDLRTIRGDEDAFERKEAFRTGRLKRLTPIRFQ
ncbi:MAG: hypothetical protein FWH27_12000 [Planctomycetaceae bacterium]|nr:hypothetical protein [Planctomycetaceae bacterium]